MSANVITTARKALETEIFATGIYSHLAAKYRDKSALPFTNIVEMEKGHISFWTDFLKKRGVETSKIAPGKLRLVLYKLMLRLIGKGLTLRMMETNEEQAIELYSSMQDDPELNAEEKQGLIKVLEDELVHEEMLVKEEIQLGGFIAYVKDAVLGVSDGLVEILSVTTGLAGASGSPMVVAIAGLVVGIAGALSMGASTYTSVRSQRQVHEGILKRIFSASKYVAHLFKERVSSHLEKQGYSKRLAGEMAEESTRNHKLLSTFISEQEYGLREENLGNPVKASLYAGLANLFGAFIPLLPYFFTSNITTALIISLILATVALAVTGFFVSILAYMSPGRKIGEMVLSGLGSAAITYGIGRGASVLLGTRPM